MTKQPGDTLCNHWNPDQIDRIAAFAQEYCIKRKPTLWGNELLCLHCGAHGNLAAEALKSHCKTMNHTLYLRPANVELYCGRCGDFQYSRKFDRLVNKKRPNYVESFTPILSSSDNSYKRTLRNHSKKGTRGICNMGSTCFMSVVLQILLHINSVVQNNQMQDQFVDEFPCHDDKTPAEGGGGCIVCGLREVFIENGVDSSNALVPAKLLFCVWNYADYLADYDQQDAHEFFIALINGWNTDIRTNHYFPYKNASSPRASDIKLGGMTQIFSGVMRSKLTCMTCGKESYRDQDFIDIGLSVDAKVGKTVKGDTISITDCLKQYIAIENLEDVHCEHCKRNSPAQLQLAIAQLPQVLVLHLKRFDAIHKRKIDSKVTFPLQGLDMSPFFTTKIYNKDNTSDVLFSKAGDQSIMYDLLGVVTHIGTLAHGHYIAYVSKHVDDNVTWLKCDDESVTLQSETDVENAQGYLLFYGRNK